MRPTANTPCTFVALKAYVGSTGNVHLRGTVKGKRLNVIVRPDRDGKGQPVQVARLKELIEEAN